MRRLQLAVKDMVVFLPLVVAAARVAELGHIGEVSTYTHC